jgi:AcrR family transcriptional regulator
VSSLSDVKFGRLKEIVNPSRPRYGEARDALLAAAIRTVARLGLRGLTYRAVAAEAGVSYGAVSHHFGSRDALIAEALQLSAARAVGLSSLEPKTGRIEDFVDDLTTAVEQAKDAHAFQFELALESRRDRALELPVRDLYQLYERAISRELSRIGFGEDAAFARLVFAALDGLVFQQVIGVSSRREVEESLARLREMLATLGAGLEPEVATDKDRSGGGSTTSFW